MGLSPKKKAADFDRGSARLGVSVARLCCKAVETGPAVWRAGQPSLPVALAWRRVSPSFAAHVRGAGWPASEGPLGRRGSAVDISQFIERGRPEGYCCEKKKNRFFLPEHSHMKKEGQDSSGSATAPRSQIRLSPSALLRLYFQFLFYNPTQRNILLLSPDDEIAFAMSIKYIFWDLYQCDSRLLMLHVKARRLLLFLGGQRNAVVDGGVVGDKISKREDLRCSIFLENRRCRLIFSIPTQRRNRTTFTAQIHFQRERERNGSFTKTESSLFSPEVRAPAGASGERKGCQQLSGFLPSPCPVTWRGVGVEQGRAVAAAPSLPVALAWRPWSVPPSLRCAGAGGRSEGHGSAMDAVDISQFSEEEQRILRNVFARAQDEEERDKNKFREEQERIRLLEAAVENLRQKAGVDLESTCNICFKTKFADGIGHICSQCGKRCCARCGVKVPLRLNKIWLCILCRKNKELAIKFGNWALKKDSVSQSQKTWGRSKSLEEEANTERQSPIPLLKRHFTSNLNIANTSLSFWSDEKKQQPAARPDPLPPHREDPLLSSPAPPHSRAEPSDGSGLQRRYTRRRSSLDTIRNDSLSSDQSENPPAAPRPKPKKGNGHRYRRSGSSESEDDARSSPSSCQDSESDRGTGHRRHPCHVPEPRRPYAEPRRHRRWDAGEGNTKDSGIDTSSSATLSEDTHKHNVYWKISPDGRRYLGYITLRKELKQTHEGSRRENLGMRVIGGHVVDDDGTIGALVEDTMKGSLADRVGRILPNDEVLEWNKIKFRGLSRDEVHQIILLSKEDPQVQLIVSRPIGGTVPSPLRDSLDGRRPPRHMEVHPEAMPREVRRLPPPHLEVYPEPMHRSMMQDPRSTRFSGRHAPRRSVAPSVATIGGKIKVRYWYDPAEQKLHGTVECAQDLPQRPDGSPRWPYVKIFLLPEEWGNCRTRSKCIAGTNNPQWNIGFSFNIGQSELRHRTLQINVWDYKDEKTGGCNDFLGEVQIPLRGGVYSESRWYNLTMHRETPKITRSPPISPSASRMSDEDLSDFDDKFSEHTERRIMAVDSSPPFYEEDRRRQSNIPFASQAMMTSPMGERSRSLTAPSPTSEYSRGRMREPGYGDRRRSRSMADHPPRHMPSHGSRSVSPPQYRSEFHPIPRVASSQRLPPPQNSLRKRQLPQVPLSRSEFQERFYLGRNSVTGSTTGSFGSEYDRFSAPRRGGGSRMAAALGVSASSPLVSPDRSDSESSSKFNLSSAFHRNSRTFEEFRGRSSDYGGPVHPSSREIDGSLSDTAVGLMDKAKVSIHRSSNLDSANRSPYLSKKSRSTSQLSGTGHKKLPFFRRSNGSSSSLVVQRSEEILPDVRAGSSISSDGSISGDSLTSGELFQMYLIIFFVESETSLPGSSKYSMSFTPICYSICGEEASGSTPSLMGTARSRGRSWGSRLPPEVGEASSFVEGLGPGQLVGRQALASPSLGEVQLGINEKRNCLEVEVIRARGLMSKNPKVLPGDSVGELQQHGTESVHGRGADSSGRHRHCERCDRVVQALPPFVAGEQPHRQRSQLVLVPGQLRLKELPHSVNVTHLLCDKGGHQASG
ncbi:Regulating synaptic membrane exocytosis protein like [Argiope bruennichi]|uniref:Regulating synaptic membrane exocytosis protein like n=1 Tax=Argiope bruennichi TaxID=94029 RepID=A0A8T0E6L4_ARGBR|nr:Regulating synaptic membrane exocytosis protein like [Argiope bruennichi]